MIVLSISGLQDGEHPFDISVPVARIPDLLSEFTGDVHVQGILTKHEQRISLQCTVQASARLECDRSLEMFDEPITLQLRREYVKDTSRAIEQGAGADETEDVIAIREDARHIDITDDVRQELALSLPMRRVAPQYRDVPFNELYPDLADRDAEATDPDVVNERWAALKKLKDI